MTRIRTFCFALTALATACSGTDVGNPTVDVDFALLQTAPTLTVEQAWLAVERVRLRSDAACSGETEEEYQGPFAVDLLAAGAPRGLADLEIAAGGYCSFEFKWQAFSSGLPADAPDELAEASVFIAGRTAEDVPFVLRSARDDEFRLDAVAGSFSIDEATAALFVALDTTSLFNGVEFAAGAVDANGTLTIDGEQNTALLEAFNINLRAAARLFADQDGNGELDADESKDGDELAD